jgi:hypothetical protein
MVGVSCVFCSHTVVYRTLVSGIMRLNIKVFEDGYLLGCPYSLIVLIIDAGSTSETSVNFYQTTRGNNPEDSHLHTRRRENLKPHMKVFR